MGKVKGITIAVQVDDASRPRKVTKVVGLGAQAGFAAVMPYHRARSGLAAKMPIDYKKVGESRISIEDMVAFTAEARVKLSYHPDGFVHFSSEVQGKIISGLDRKTGKPKGLGLFSSPLTDPMRSGPSFAITAWGLNDFDELPTNDREVVIFRPKDLYFRDAPEIISGVIIEFFVFPSRYCAGIRRQGGELILSMAFRQFEASGAVINLKVIDLPGKGIILAAFASHIRVAFRSSSGWVLNGPGERKPDGTGTVLMACYPRDTLPVSGLPSLDRSSPEA